MKFDVILKTTIEVTDCEAYEDTLTAAKFEAEKIARDNSLTVQMLHPAGTDINIKKVSE